jgi:hypothetical protein
MASSQHTAVASRRGDHEQLVMVVISIRQLFYVSAVEGALSRDAVDRLLHLSRRNNDKADITGCLLFSGRTFAQVLEGPTQAVQLLADRIAADQRHSRLRFLLTRDLQHRTYASWSMAYLYSMDFEDQLRGLLDGPVAAEQAELLLQRMQPDALGGAL